MKDDLIVKNGVTIPFHELEITTARAGGPGGQHVNRTDTRITIRWNVANTNCLKEEQKTLVLKKLQARLTNEGELIVHNNESRSQLYNKKAALDTLVRIIRKALFVPKKRIATKIPSSVKESRLRSKERRSGIKKMRSKIHYDE